MNKLYNYLQKLGIEERPAHGSHMEEPPAVFYRQTYGDPDYFTNAPNHTHPGVIVALDYNAEAPAAYFEYLTEKEKKIAAYCKKYGYICEKTAHPWTVFFRIEKASDREAARDYYDFRDASREECEQYLHIAYTNGTPQKEIEANLQRIMQKYGEAYKDFLQATA